MLRHPPPPAQRKNPHAGFEGVAGSVPHEPLIGIRPPPPPGPLAGVRGGGPSGLAFFLPRFFQNGVLPQD